MKYMEFMKWSLVLVSVIVISGCGLFSSDGDVKGVSTDIPNIEHIWVPENSWDQEWETKYQVWLTENLEEVSLPEETEANVNNHSGNGTKMFAEYVHPIEKIIEDKKNKPDFHLDCADNVIFFRALFAKINKLPFMLRVAPYGKQNEWWFVGHFGFRDGDDYKKTAKSDKKFSYTRYKDDEVRFAMFIYGVSAYFGVTSFSSSVGKSGDVYDIHPKDFRVGDFFIQGDYGQGGHSLTFGKIDFTESPFLTGYSYNQYQSLLYLMNDSYNSRKGGGLKRWKWAVKGQSESGEEIWLNEVQTGDTAYQATYDSDGEEKNENNRRELFKNYVIKQVEGNGSSITDIVNDGVQKIKESIVHLAKNPSSCNTRTRMTKLFENVYGYANLMDQMPEEFNIYGSIWGVLSTLFPSPLEYEASALCGWNSSNFELFARILETNRDYITKYIEDVRNYNKDYPLYGFSSIYLLLGLEEDLRALDQTQLKADIALANDAQEASFFPADENSNNTVDNESSPLIAELVKSPQDGYQGPDFDNSSSDGYQGPDFDGDNYNGNDSLSTQPIKVKYYPFSAENICLFAPSDSSSWAKWSADEAWLMEKEELWPSCYKH